MNKYNAIGHLTMEELSQDLLEDIKDIAVEVAGIEEAETTSFDASKYQEGHVMYQVDDVQEAIDKLTDLVDNTASHVEDGLMAKDDKIKLDSIEQGANKYVHPTTPGNKHVPAGGSANQILRWSADGTAVWSNENNIPHRLATTSEDGLMSSTDKIKIDGIAANATKVEASSTNGKIKINGAETTVYTHPSGTNPHGTTKSDIGLGNVDNTSDINKPVSIATQTELNKKADKTGDSQTDFNVKSLNVSGPILPTTTGIDIGSPNNRFRGIYVDEAYLSTNTLYIGDTPIMGTEGDTINIKADPDQSIMLKTSAGGTTKISSESGTELSTTGMNADVVLKASGSGAKVNVSGDQQVNFTAPDINFNGSSTFKDDAVIKKSLVVEGDLLVKGKNHIIESETVSIKDNIIEVNKGQIGSGVTAGQAGLKVDRGDAPAYYMVFDEVDDMFKVGMDNSLQTIASRDWVNSVMYTHPGTHPATIITQDATHRFFTDTERTKLSNIAEGANKTVLNNTVTSTSTTEAATANAVKLAYDKANHTHPYAASSHTHDDRYYTETEVNSLLNSKANTSHGNHVPTTQTANNAVFLRNDNTWQTVTPANIGAAASSHTHNYAGSSSAGGAANSAVKLATARTINGVSFDGSANITIADSTKLPLAGGTLTGVLNTNSQIKSTVATGTAPFTITSTTVVSNLNADLLDGIHASSFLRSDTSNAYDVRLKDGDGRGIRFWDSDSYKICMSIATNSTYGGRMTGDTTSDYNMYFKMSSGTNRGFVFKGTSGNVMGIDGNGDLRVRGSASIGDNKVKMQYNASTESLDFIFA